jgi:hypothetical protein
MLESRTPIVQELVVALGLQTRKIIFTTLGRLFLGSGAVFTLYGVYLNWMATPAPDSASGHVVKWTSNGLMLRGTGTIAVYLTKAESRTFIGLMLFSGLSMCLALLLGWRWKLIPPIKSRKLW